MVVGKRVLKLDLSYKTQLYMAQTSAVAVDLMGTPIGVSHVLHDEVRGGQGFVGVQCRQSEKAYFNFKHEWNLLPPRPGVPGLVSLGFLDKTQDF